MHLLDLASNQEKFERVQFRQTLLRCKIMKLKNHRIPGRKGTSRTICFNFTLQKRALDKKPVQLNL